MAIKDVIWEMEQAALHAALLAKATADTPETRAAYASGVRAMAGLVHACIKVAEDMAEKNKDNALAHNMLAGYAASLNMIVSTAEDLIPPGYE